jgi:hypothetical protein
VTGLPTLRETFDEAVVKQLTDWLGLGRGAAAADAARGEGARRGRRSLADRLLAYALAAVDELFVDQFGQPHARLGDQAVPLPRGAYAWLRRLAYEREGCSVAGETLQTVAGTLEARALAEGATRALFVRSAWQRDALYVELRPGRVVRIAADGWALDPTPPVLFRRLPNLEPLPDPARGGDLDALLALIPTRRAADRRLLRAYIALALVEHIPRPIWLATGPQGAGKSTAQRLVKRLLDPTRPAMLRLDPRDAIQKASHAQLVLFDNLSRLQDWATDILCRLVTGEGDSKRRLYTDDDDVIYELQRAVLLNGVNPPADRADFNDRLLPIELERIADAERVPERVVWAQFAQHHARWLGAAFDLLAAALRLRPEILLPWLPRLADWGELAAAVYVAAGDTVEAFLADWQAVVVKQHAAVVEGSPTAQAVLAFLQDRAEWQGTASELHAALTPLAGQLALTLDKSWPRSAKSLGRRLRELVPVLAARGVALTQEHDRHGTRVTIRKVPNKNVTNVTRGPNGLSIGERGDDTRDISPPAVPRNATRNVTREPASEAGCDVCDECDVSVGAFSEDASVPPDASGRTEQVGAPLPSRPGATPCPECGRPSELGALCPVCYVERHGPPRPGSKPCPPCAARGRLTWIPETHTLCLACEKAGAVP